MVRRPLAAALTTALLGSGLFLAAAPVAGAAPATPAAAASVAQALATPRVFKNCTELNKVYKHGVGRKGARDKVTGKSKPVTTFKVDTATYNANKKSDGDKDGIACEKR
ncbi:excalibur calcium-binding domain-containing protein [Nakamurella sp. A5-74]|uniref:Excalibur calcium-binding domain-containing protein n=1 Tax=Nakamurella sp. A5-74 TaxID=3158264 RepID=A0AAU8DP48_9ACTN